MGYLKRFMLLGSGELGREFVIAAKRLGHYVVSIGRYQNAPAMQLSDAYEVIDMFESDELERVVQKYSPDYIVPEIEAINIEKLVELEQRGVNVIPCANAVKVCLDRKALRLLATELGLKTANYTFAKSKDELEKGCNKIGFPCVVKPLMSSSGKGQTVLRSKEDIDTAWTNLDKSRGTSSEAIVEQFINIDTEITLLTISTRGEEVLYCEPIGHTQSHGDYQESWQPADTRIGDKTTMRIMAEKMVRKLGGVGLWGTEFFISKDGQVYFSEISPRPHDTGMVTLTNTQQLNQFELHLYAILGLEIVNNSSTIPLLQSGASRAICYEGHSNGPYTVTNIGQALEMSTASTKIYMFNKPVTHPKRRLGVIISNCYCTPNIVSALRNANKNTRKRIKITTL